MVLDRNISDRRIYPALNILKSGTRKDELLLKPENLAKIWAIRNVIATMDDVEALKFLYPKMQKTKNNEEFQERRGEQSVKNINNIGGKCG